MTNVLKVLRRHADFSQRILGCISHVLQMPALIVVSHIEDFPVFAGHGVAVQRLHLHVLAKRIEVARLFELLLLGCKLLDYLL
ncbi:MAG: hypothetical protein DMG94_07700 [Acidobacteria bacterium]|nr:MAG: hypothetical protein DMG94_07700 [Acidobacteriota bacterium]